MTDSYVAAPTLRAALADGRNCAYRRIGPSGGRPLVLLQHFRGSLENWDPALIDLLARKRDVITFDNIGVSGSEGLTPDTITQMARDAIAFLTSLQIFRADILGFSIGSFVAQELTLLRPSLVERLVLASSAPRGARGMHGWAEDVVAAVGSPQTTSAGLLSVFFRDTPTSQAAGRAYLGRFGQRQADRDPLSSWQTRNAQYDAVLDWGVPNHAMLERLEGLTRPVFVANGDDDRMILPRYSHLLAGLLPDAMIKIYPDAAHGFLFQHHVEFAADVDRFLAGQPISPADQMALDLEPAAPAAEI